VSNTIPLRRFSSAATSTRAAAGNRLKLVQYLPRGGEPHVCAAIWGEGACVHLVSPLLRTHRGVRDPQSYARQFPDGLASIDAFEDSMSWLDAACYAARDPREVDAACRQHPEWQLRCIRYDGGDTALLGLSGLLRAAENAGPLPAPIMRGCLIELVKQILKSEDALAGGQIEATFHEGEDVAKLEFGMHRTVLVTMLDNVASTDVVGLGLQAHRRLAAQYDGSLHCLLVATGLQLDAPVILSARAALTDMDPEHVRAALVRLAQC